MAVDLAALKPGDVLVIRTPDQAGWWIRRRALMLKYPWQPWRWLSDKATLVNHVALYTHTDEAGQRRGLEGRPGGFGWVNLAGYLADPATVANSGQPKTDEQRGKIVTLATTMVGIPYDWRAILAFAGGAAGLRFNAAEWPEDGVPSHVVCSSALDYVYEAVGLPNPGGYTKTRGTDPQDWEEFVVRKLWLEQPAG